MNYGHFDLENKEYVITRPDTPAPWANYLGDPEYGAMISGNAEGYSFVKSGANGRLLRYRFNTNLALPGRFIYIRDNDTADYWSASWQPVGKPLDKYKSECRHGTAYTVISAEYANVKSQVTYYVPKGKTYEVWRAVITNLDSKPRKLSVYGFCEFTNDNNYEQDQVNLQYTQFITRTSFEENKILQHINENSGKWADGSNHRERFFGMVGSDVCYRVTVQDIQGIIHLDPEMAADKIRFMLSAQVDNGAGLPLVKFNHNAGHETCPDENDENSIYAKETGHPSYRADDALWLFPTISKYIGESGNKAFLDEVILYSNGGEDTVYNHLKKAIDFSMNHLGGHDMPAGLHADWNDCLRMGKKGESTFVAFQLYYAMTVLKGYAQEKNDTDYIKYLDDVQGKLGASLAKCWDEDRFIRGIREDGVIVGAKKDPEANMWLNPQSWSVISGFASKEQGEKAMESVHEILNTPYGVKLLEPPYVKDYFDGALMHIFNPDTKENGGIFSQSQGWAILAESLLGHGNRAFEYFMESSPAAMNDKAEVRVIEPYAHGQFTESTRSPFEGRSHVHWLTGTASTVMVGCVEGILGMRPNSDGLTVAPAIPSDWASYTVEKTFRGKKLNMTFNNPNHAESGVSSIVLNGEKLDGNFIPADKLKEENEITVTLG